MNHKHRIKPGPGEREPRFIEDPTSTVTLAEVRASVSYEAERMRQEGPRPKEAKP